MSKKLIGTLGFLIALVFLLGLNAFSNTALRGARLDLTENKLYTLSEGSRNIVESLEEPITLRFFYSEELGRSTPMLSVYARRVRELLEEYENASNGKIDLEVIDPQPFSEAEERAVRAGIQAIPISQTESLYFGLQGTNTLDGKRTIPFFHPDKEPFLEYDLSELIYDLANPERRKLVIVSDLPIQGEQTPMMSPGQQQNPPWTIYDELQQLYDIEVVKNSAESLPEDIDALMVVHPKNLSERLRYEIDQYVLGGGRAIVYVDPVAEVDQQPANPQNPLQSMSAPKNSNMPDVFDQWGIELVEGKVLGDRARAQQVMAGSRTNPQPVDFVLYPSLEGEDLNSEDFLTSQLENISLASSGVLRVKEDAQTDVTPLIQSSEDSMLIDASSAQMFPQPQELLRKFEPTGQRQTVAARITGDVETAFPDGPPATGEEGEGESANEAAAENHLTESVKPIMAVVVADVDMLSDRAWVQVRRLLNMRIPNVIASNGDFANNAVDQLSGSDDLVSIRGRGDFRRPFTVVQEMEQQAREESAEKIRELEQELEQTRQRLRELQQQAPEGSGALISSQDLQDEIENYQVQEVETRRELRRLERSLREEVDQLGNWLKFINIGLMPILVGVAAVGLGLFRVSRRKRH